jgi:serine/threonine-protein kinase
MPSHAPSDAPRPGSLIAGRYRLDAQIGSGGMADVWDALDERLHRRVALKLLRVDGTSADEAAVARRRFHDEGQLAARTTHRTIVTVFDAGEEDGRAYLVMERLSGETLADRLAVRGLDEGEVRTLMADVLSALEVAHRAGIVHRDVKPSNVLAAPGGRWKVADFGIAKEVDGARTGDRTIAGQVVGTPRFMAPERLAGHPATVASDVYSAGMVLREVLAQGSDVDPVWGLVAARATDPDPAERFTSAAAMAAATVITGPLEPSAGDATRVAGPVAPSAVPTRDLAAPPTRPMAVATAGGRRLPRRTRAVAAGIAALAVAGGLAAAAVHDGDGGADRRPPAATSSTDASVPSTSSVPPAATAPPTSSTRSTSTTTSTSSTTTTTTPGRGKPPGPKDPGGKPKEEKGPGRGKG